MAKYYGKVGYVYTKETAPGVWKEVREEHSHYGDVLSNFRRWGENSESTNDDFLINNKLSLVMDAFVIEHASEIRYVEYMGAKWKVTNIEIEHPRVILTLGGLYNANKIRTP